MQILILIVLLLCLDIAGGYFFDPFGLYHRGGQTAYIGDSRIDAASALRNLDYDCLLLGTSMIANTDIQQVEQLLNGKCINISVYGATLFERNLVLEHAMSIGKAETVILSLDYWGEHGSANPSVNLDSFNFLYDGNPLNDLKLYIGFRWIYYLSKVGKQADENEKREEFNAFARWDDSRELARFGGIENWVFGDADKRTIRAVRSIIDIVDNCNGNEEMSSEILRSQLREQKAPFLLDLSQVIEGSPRVRFIGFFPPYSSLKRSLDYNCSRVSHEGYLVELNLATQLADEMSNFTVFGFDSEPFTSDLIYYKDTRHYSPLINQVIVSKMLSGTTPSKSLFCKNTLKILRAWQLGKICETTNINCKRKLRNIRFAIFNALTTS